MTPRIEACQVTDAEEQRARELLAAEMYRDDPLSGQDYVERKIRIGCLVGSGQAIRAIIEAERAAMREAAEIVRERIYPKNEQSDWTEYALTRAQACEQAEAAIFKAAEGKSP